MMAWGCSPGRGARQRADGPPRSLDAVEDVPAAVVELAVVDVAAVAGLGELAQLAEQVDQRGGGDGHVGVGGLDLEGTVPGAQEEQRLERVVGDAEQLDLVALGR